MFLYLFVYHMIIYLHTRETRISGWCSHTKRIQSFIYVEHTNCESRKVWTRNDFNVSTAHQFVNQSTISVWFYILRAFLPQIVLLLIQIVVLQFGWSSSFCRIYILIEHTDDNGNRSAGWIYYIHTTRVHMNCDGELMAKFTYAWSQVAQLATESKYI